MSSDPTNPLATAEALRGLEQTREALRAKGPLNFTVALEHVVHTQAVIAAAAVGQHLVLVEEAPDLGFGQIQSAISIARGQWSTSPDLAASLFVKIAEVASSCWHEQIVLDCAKELVRNSRQQEGIKVSDIALSNLRSALSRDDRIELKAQKGLTVASIELALGRNTVPRDLDRWAKAWWHAMADETLTAFRKASTQANNLLMQLNPVIDSNVCFMILARYIRTCSSDMWLVVGPVRRMTDQLALAKPQETIATLVKGLNVASDSVHQQICLLLTSHGCDQIGKNPALALEFLEAVLMDSTYGEQARHLLSTQVKSLADSRTDVRVNLERVVDLGKVAGQNNSPTNAFVVEVVVDALGSSTNFRHHPWMRRAAIEAVRDASIGGLV